MKITIEGIIDQFPWPTLDLKEISRGLGSKIKNLDPSEILNFYLSLSK